MLTAERSLGEVLAEESAKLEMAMVGRSRRYLTPTKALYPSVTTVLGESIPKPALVHWSGVVERELCVDSFVSLRRDLNGTLPEGDALRTLCLDRIGTKLACYRKRDEAGETGTAAHALIEYQLKRQLGFAGLSEPEIPSGPMGERALWAYLHYEQFAKDTNLRPVAMEVGVWSDEGFAGRLDLLAYVEDKLSILDWKTGKAIYAEAHIQNAAYRIALNERLQALRRPERVIAGHIVLLPKDLNSEATWTVAAIGNDDAAATAFRGALVLWRALEALKKEGVK